MGVVVKTIRFGDELVLEDGTSIVISKRTKKVTTPSGYVVVVIKRDCDIGKIIVRKERREVDGNLQCNGVT